MTVLIVERDGRGHRLMYVRLLASRALLQGLNVTIVVPPQCVGSPHLHPLESTVEIIGLPGIDSLSLAQIKRRSGVDPSLIVVPDGDREAMKIGFAGGVRDSHVAVLVMRDPSLAKPPRFSTSALTRSIKLMLLRLAARRRRVSVFVLRAPGETRHSIFRVVTDPVTWAASPQSMQLIRTNRGIADDRFWFGIIGAITARKNIGLVAAALARVADASRLGLLIAGQQAADVRESAEAVRRLSVDAGILVVEVNELLSDAELDNMVGIVDCLVLAHSNEGPSGLLGKAVASRTAVLAAGADSLRLDVERLYVSGGIWTPLEESALSDAASKIVRDGESSEVITRDGLLSGSDSFDVMLEWPPRRG